MPRRRFLRSGPAPLAHLLHGSERSHTFHGRDVFAVVGAKLASGQIHLADVGPRLPDAPRFGDTFLVEIRHEDKPVWSGKAPLARTFGDVPEGEPLLYLNSLGDLALALNMADFAKAHGVGYGAGWSIQVSPIVRRIPSTTR